MSRSLQDCLQQLKVLQGVSPEALEELVASSTLRELAPGDVLLSLGQPNRVMYMVLAGKLTVHLESPTSDPVASLHAGETVGELSVMDERDASAFVVAAEPTRLLALGEEGFWNLVETSHAFAINLLLLLADRLRTNNSTVSNNIRLQREYRRNALIDGLTSLYNRRWLDESLPRIMQRAERGSQPLALLMMDVDHFKKFNDTYGHPAGDQVLKHVAQVLRQNLRPTDVSARYGGEEFCVVLPHTDAQGAIQAAERLRLAVSQTVVQAPNGEPLPRVTISIGAAQMQTSQSMELLIAEADAALYESKHGGRNRVTLRAVSAPVVGG